MRCEAAALVAMVLAGCAEAHQADAGREAGTIDAGSEGGTTELDADVQHDAGDAGLPRHEEFFDFCVRAGLLYCAGARDCCTVLDRMREDCSPERWALYCEPFAVDPALHDGTLIWHGAEAAAHLELLEAALATCGPIDRHRGIFSFIEGTLGEGENCTPFRPHLDSLGRLGCRAGLRCELTGTRSDYAGQCTALGLAGDSCNDECADGFYCRGRTREMMEPYYGWCAAIDTSSPCRSDLECESVYCHFGVCEDPSDINSWCTRRL